MLSLKFTNELFVVMVVAVVTQARNHCIVQKGFIEGCGKDCYAMRCNSMRLQEVPKSYPGFNDTYTPDISLLDLSYNNITTLENGSFVKAANLTASTIRWLYLQNNRLKNMSSDAFEGLHNLLYLNLSWNMLVWKRSFGEGVFRPLISLTHLNLKVNHFESSEDLDVELSYLRNLRGLLLSPSSSNFNFGPKFQTLFNLSLLSLSGLSRTSCKMEHIGNDTFKYLGQITKLFVTNCNISKIESNAFKPLQNLTDLDLSYNENLTFWRMNTALYGLRNSSLKQLRVNKIHKFYGLGLVLKIEHLENLRALGNLTTLHMDLNKIEVINEAIFTPKCIFPPSLKTLTMAGNRLSYDRYTHYIYLADHIQTLDISRQHFTFDPHYYDDENFNEEVREGVDRIKHVVQLERFFSPANIGYLANSFSSYNLSLECNCSKVNKKYICFPSNLTNLMFHRSVLYTEIPRLIICNGFSIERLGMSSNIIYTWSGPVYGLQNVRYLDLSNNQCNNISADFFFFFPALECLNISGNYLRNVLDDRQNRDADKIFRTQKNITTLILSKNHLHFLAPHLLENMSRLEYLDLGNNNLKEWTTILNSKQLKFLNLVGNKLRELPESLRNFLDDSRKRGNVTLLLHNNKIDCSQCESLPFLKWVTKTEVDVEFSQYDTCLVNEKVEGLTSKDDVKKIVRILENDVCNKHTWITSTVAGSAGLLGCILTLIIGTAVYRSRWKLRYFYYRKRRYTHKGFQRLFSRDAYISYSKGRAQFIYDTLVPALEKRHDLHLWVTDRDSEAGASVAENIVHGICNSRKSVFLIDEQFLTDSWCDYDINMALLESIETNRNAIIIVLIENVSAGMIPVHIIRFLKNEPPLEYPTNDEDLETFWQSLAFEINKTPDDAATLQRS